MQKNRECLAMIGCMAQILGNVQVKAKLSIEPLCHKYFPQPAFPWSKLTIETLEGVKFVTNKDTRTAALKWRHYTINDVVWVSIVNFDCISHLSLLFLLLALNK